MPSKGHCPEHVSVIIIAFFMPIFSLVIGIFVVLPLYDVVAHKFGLLLITSTATNYLFLGFSVFLGMYLFMAMSQILVQINAHYQKFAHNVLFGIYAYYGFHHFVLHYRGKNQHDYGNHISPNHILISFYFMFTSFRLFLQSLLVGLLCNSVQLSNETDKQRVAKFIPLAEWNEPFKSHLTAFFYFSLLYILPVAEFFIEIRYWPLMTPQHEVLFSIIVIVLIILMLAVYGIILYANGDNVPELKVFSSPAAFSDWVRVNRKWMQAKALLEYLLLLFSQLILLNPVSFMVAAILWPVWKIYFAAHPYWELSDGGPDSFFSENENIESREMVSYEAESEDVIIQI